MPIKSRTADSVTEGCPDCGGDGVVQNPCWAVWWKQYYAAEKAWEAAHPGGDWCGSVEYRELDECSSYLPIDEEDPCPTCEGHGDVDRLIRNLDSLADVVTNSELSELLATAARWREGSDAADAEKLIRDWPRSGRTSIQPHESRGPNCRG